MADIQLDTELTPNAPSAGTGVVYLDSTTKLLTTRLDSGAIQSGPALFLANQSITTPAAGFAVDTYLVGSAIAFPAGFPRVGTTYRLFFDIAKTNAGVATPILTVRFGLTGSLTDTARLIFTFGAGTAAVDTGTMELTVLFRTVGSGVAAIVQGVAELRHQLASTGLTSTGTAGNAIIPQTSAGFDSAPVGSVLGVSVNGGASAAWTITLVRAEVVSL